MFDTAPQPQRVHGHAHVTLGRHGLRDLRQQGSAKAMLPRTHEPDPEVVFLNTAGGVTDGDALSYGLTLGPGARATAATQTAERAYRAARDTPGRLATRISLGAAASLDWLPQELIAFEGCHVVRDTEIDLAPGARLLMADMLVLGRAAHGEQVRHAKIADKRTVRQAGRLIHQEHLALGPEHLTDAQVLGPHRAVATLVLVSPDAADRLGCLRAALAGQGHASLAPGRVVGRLAGPDAAPVRRTLIRALEVLRGRPVPRVWQSDVSGK